MSVPFCNEFDFLPKTGRPASFGAPDGPFPFFTSSQEVSRRTDSADCIGPALVFGTGGAASIHYVEGPFSATNDCYVAVPKSRNAVDAKFYYRFLRTSMYLIESGFRGAGLRHVSKKHLEAIPLPKCKGIDRANVNSILDKADAIRRKREQALALADDFLKSVFLEMFGDPASNKNGLNKAPLGEIIKVSSGDGLTAKNMSPDGIYPVYGGNGINGYHSEYMFEEPQIVIGRVGVYCGAVHVSEPRSWITDNALYVREYKKPINKTYLEWALRFANLNQYAGRAAQPLISGGRIYEVEILEPEESQQKVFERLVRDHRTLVSKLSIDKDLSGQLFSALSQRAFRGEL